MPAGLSEKDRIPVLRVLRGGGVAIGLGRLVLVRPDVQVIVGEVIVVPNVVMIVVHRLHAGVREQCDREQRGRNETSQTDRQAFHLDLSEASPVIVPEGKQTGASVLRTP